MRRSTNLLFAIGFTTLGLSSCSNPPSHLRVPPAVALPHPDSDLLTIGYGGGMVFDTVPPNFTLQLKRDGSAKLWVVSMWLPDGRYSAVLSPAHRDALWCTAHTYQALPSLVCFAPGGHAGSFRVQDSAGGIFAEVPTTAVRSSCLAPLYDLTELVLAASPWTPIPE